MKLIYSTTSLILAPILAAAPVTPPVSAEQGASLTLQAAAQNTSIDIVVKQDTGAPVPDAAVIVRLPDDSPTGVFANDSHAQVLYTDATGHARATGIRWTAKAGTVAIQITATKGESHAGTILEESLGPQVESSPAVAAAPAAPVPAVPTPKAAIAPPLQPPVTAPSPEIPHVSITSHPADGKVSSGSHKKWIILALAIGAGAGAAFTFSGKKSGSSNASSSTTTIGSPTISVGHP